MEINTVPHLTNSFYLADRVSSACDWNLINEVESNDEYVDKYYGNVWSWTPKIGTGLYGKTELLPNISIDSLPNEGFLRVPYRRIPLIVVDNLADLRNFVMSIRSETKEQFAMWRGQNELYCLPRSKDDQLILYGEHGVLEPSLIPSATRSNVTFESVFDTWSAAMELYLQYGQPELTNSNTQRTNEIWEFLNTYNFKLWSMATAQHYGLPSSGLDLTNDLDIALYFALHKFRPSENPGGGMLVERVDDNANPVLYGFSVYDADLIVDKYLAPDYLQCERPKSQSAHYFNTAWGNASNKAADRMWIAFSIRNHAKWEIKTTTADLFPDVSKDHFADFLLNKLSKLKDNHLNDLIKKIYFIESELSARKPE